MKLKVSGTFEAVLEPMNTHATGMHGVTLARMSIDKIFQGELEAVSKGEMLSALTSVNGSAGYVAIEQVVGSLAGKKGSFVLQHFGIMRDGDNRLVLEVIPDSGTGDLKGLQGKMNIRIEDDNHFYDFDYSLP